jgi:hypothetical protein
MNVIVYIPDMNAAGRPVVERLTGRGYEGSAALERAIRARSYAQYDGQLVESETGEDFPGVLAVADDGDIIDLLPIDGRSLRRGGTVTTVFNGVTYNFQYTEIHVN